MCVCVCLCALNINVCAIAYVLDESKPKPHTASPKHRSPTLQTLNRDAQLDSEIARAKRLVSKLESVRAERGDATRSMLVARYLLICD
jgi:hypothetical protein